MGDWIWIFFIEPIKVKQGHPIPPTVFGLCIDDFELIVDKSIKQENIEEVTIGTNDYHTYETMCSFP